LFVPGLVPVQFICSRSGKQIAWAKVYDLRISKIGLASPIFLVSQKKFQSPDGIGINGSGFERYISSHHLILPAAASKHIAAVRAGRRRESHKQQRTRAFRASVPVLRFKIELFVR
jgi:hypothetical protein